MKNKKRWIALAIIMLLIGGCFGDRMVASVVFQHYCKTLPGLYVYEKVELGDEYFLPRPEEGTIESRKLSSEWIYDDELQFNKQKIQQDYQYIHLEVSQLFSMGPINQHQAYIMEIDSQKTLSQAVGLTNRKGFLNDNFFKARRESCPNGRDKENIALLYKHHENLLRETFIKRN